MRDSRESLRRDISPHLSAKDQDYESSNLRMLAGQQDLSQNLRRIERNFRRALQSGETSVAAQIQEQLSGQQATTRALFDSVSQSQDAMHLHSKLMVPSIPVASVARADTDSIASFSIKS